ncbi:sushi, von Willebrand factor type A, EGF and pentraxin domain-containing protein 1-like [Dreissena polymorpha]|uniref:sushi, von Willebrand factor type A, EGF and pentraxin domain-containing protein 1-like n=1 Tax=Dreissena polymorpha TaxID=45954 RepID=UPI0022651FEA|nr:sushi, von Willebrand factor type A, EGF and pentraxin domain-containing protein 1-like [Dreissena polymorpha]
MKTELRTLFDNGCPLRYEYERMNCTRWTEYIKLRKLIPFGETCTLQVNDHELNVTCTEALTNGHKEPNSAPLVTKPAALNQANPVIAATRQKTAHVSWSGPLIRDKEDNADLTVTVTPLQSGALFTKGSYTIYFSAKDSGGRMAQTSLSFEVKDKQPPYFIECPGDISLGIDAPNNTAAVTWDIPSGTDNSNGPLEITEIHGYLPGQRFEAGSRTVTYRIKDSSNNSGDSCSFHIHVNSRSCDPPDNTRWVGDDKMIYVCPHLYTFGATCRLSCKGGYPLGGANTITCLQNINKDLEWQWDANSLKPFCKETNCTQLREPKNGAIACSEWTYGQMCLMMCQKGFDVPANIDGQFVCGTSTGLWRPSHIVPDCNVAVNPDIMNLPSEFYYYTDKCNSSTENIFEIQHNFINALNTSKYLEFCTSNPDCQAQFVSISCGPTSRKKRDTNVYRRATLQFAYIVDFEISLAYHSLPNETDNQAMDRISSMLDNIAESIHIATSNGAFDIAGLVVEADSFASGIPSVKCPPGTIARSAMSTCVGCPIGQYLSNRTRTCIECPHGSYQDSPNSINCTPCPSLTNTTGIGSSKIEDCRAPCLPGEYSPTGLVPCAKCPSSAFQPVPSSIVCSPCPSGTRAPTEGATFSDGQQSAKSCISHSSSLYTIDNLAKIQDAKIVVPSLCDATDECSSKPCGQHECINMIGDFKCHCSNGFTGRLCEVPPDLCSSNECSNGATCLHMGSNYYCQCRYGYSGLLCDRKAVDGQWSYWTEWSVCTHTCGGGTRSKTRACVSPPPEPEGLDCEGESIVSEACNTDKCPECSALRRPYGVEISCNESVEIKSCTLTCRPDFNIGCKK